MTKPVRLTRNGTVQGQTRYTNGHKHLVGHWINNGPYNRLQVVIPGDMTVDEISNPGIGKD